MPDEEMLDQGVNRAAAVAAHLMVFEDGHVARAANLARFEEGCCSIFPEAFELRARNFHDAQILYPANCPAMVRTYQRARRQGLELVQEVTKGFPAASSGVGCSGDGAQLR